jgi:hypothetical protein
MLINKNQKNVILISIILVVAAILAWQLYGGEIFTKTEILIERKDELLGTTYREWQDKFILGLDYTLAFIGTVILIAGVAFYKLRTKK